MICNCQGTLEERPIHQQGAVEKQRGEQTQTPPALDGSDASHQRVFCASARLNGRKPALGIGVVNLAQNVSDVMFQVPVGVIALEWLEI